MKISNVAVTVVEIPQIPPIAPYRSRIRSSSTTCSAIVQVDTDDGITGWGEHNVNFLPDISARHMQKSAEEWLIGRDPQNIADFHQQCPLETRLKSGIELGLWDICGKAAGLPVAVLLGGIIRSDIELAACMGIQPYDRAGEIATIVKLTHISLLGPVVFVIGLLYARHRRKQAVFVAPTVRYARLVPAFILLFIGMALLRTMGFFPQVTLHMTDRFVFGEGERVFDLAAILGQAGQWIITAAIAGVGLMTQFRVLKTAGRPFLLGLFLTAVLALLGILYAYWR